MPYINQEARRDIDSGGVATAPGELNYQITQLIADYMKENGKSYAVINNIVGALEGAKLEFYRRVAGPYEDTKIIENGDVY